MASAAPFAARAGGPNLLPNPGFEESAFEAGPVSQGTLPQPLLPAGWAFEGLAGLFDHTPNEHHAGARAAAISIPASTNNEYCVTQVATCAQNPLNLARDTARVAYSVTPHWRTLEPVGVAPAQAYRLSAFVKMSIVTVGEGATLGVRWLDASGVPISYKEFVRRPMTSNDPDVTSWIAVSGTAVAPAGAASAHILLGHTDDLWIGQIIYDDVSFGLA